MTIAGKSLKQSYSPFSKVLTLMKEFKQMTNDCIRISIENGNVSILKRLSKLSYKELMGYGVPSYFVEPKPKKDNPITYPHYVERSSASNKVW